MLIGFIASTVVLFISLFVIMMSTRGISGPLLRAWFSGKTPLFVLRKDKKMKILSEEYKGGTFDTKKLGYFMAVPESFFQLPNGMTAAMAISDMGVTINPKLARFAQRLKQGIPLIDKDGNPITDQNYLKKFAKWIEIGKINDKEIPILKLDNIDDVDEFNTAYKNEYKENFIIPAGGDTLALQDIINYFKYNINPNFIQAKIENKLAQERIGKNQINFALLVPLAMVFLILAIGYMVISNFMNSQGYQDKWAACTSQLAACKDSNPVNTIQPPISLPTGIS